MTVKKYSKSPCIFVFVYHHSKNSKDACLPRRTRGGNHYYSAISGFSRKQRKRDGREERIEWMNKGKAKGRDMSPDGASDEEERRESWNPIEYDPWLYCRYFPRAHPSPIVLGREAAEWASALPRIPPFPLVHPGTTRGPAFCPIMRAKYCRRGTTSTVVATRR